MGAVLALETATHADSDELAMVVGARLAGYKKPRWIALVPEVQRLATGKVDLYWAGHQLAPGSMTLREWARIGPVVVGDRSGNRYRMPSSFPWSARV